MTRKANSSANKTNATAETPDDVDKIRDIIFGGQMREYAARFQELEKEVADSLQRMSKELDKRFEKLERALQVRTDGLNEKLKLEASQRSADLDELHEGVAAEYEALTTRIEKTRAELIKALQADTARLDRQKVTSKDLAQLFTDLARQIKQNGP